MKTFTKTSYVAALILAAAILGAPQARAVGWPIVPVPRLRGGFAVGPVVGARAAMPFYHAGPLPFYGGPGFYAPVPVPAPVSVAVAPAYGYAPPAVCAAPYPYYYSNVRVGFGWGPRFDYGRRFYRR